MNDETPLTAQDLRFLRSNILEFGFHQARIMARVSGTEREVEARLQFIDELEAGWRAVACGGSASPLGFRDECG